MERRPVGGFGNGASSITRSKPGEAIRAEIAKRGYEAAAVLIAGSSPVLACDALAALPTAAGRDGEWHQGWADAATALQDRPESETAKRMAPLKIAGRRSSSGSRLQ